MADRGESAALRLYLYPAVEDPALQPAQMREMMRSHWENWYREKIPALGIRTPLQAAKSEEGLELLELLLIEYGRRDGKRDNSLLQPDFAELRRRLGLPSLDGENE